MTRDSLINNIQRTVNIMAFESLYVSAATVVGAITLIKLVYDASFILWLYFLRPSQLHKYRDSELSSWALVTGASDGIGLELARELLAQGFNVLVHGRNETKLEGVKRSLWSSIRNVQWRS